MRRAVPAICGWVLLHAVPAQGRGLYLESAPWYSPALSDTNLTLGAGMVAARGDTQAAIFPLVLTPIRRGPLRFAATWSYVSVRTVEGRVFGFGDPKAFARLRLAGGPDRLAVLYVEGLGRVPTARSKLYPFASGGQELEIMGTLGLPRWLGAHAGAGRIWTEPPGGGRLRRVDLPHAVHAWALARYDLGPIHLLARDDELWMKGNHRRSQVETSITYSVPRRLRITAAFRFETGPRSERVLVRSYGLSFATPLH